MFIKEYALIPFPVRLSSADWVLIAILNIGMMQQCLGVAVSLVWKSGFPT